MGIILLVVALLPLLGVSGMRLVKSEFPGYELDKIKPRMVETAKTIWIIYIFITLGEIVCLYLFGMPLFDAVINTFGTVPTGGFNHKNASIAYYDKVIFEVIIMIFMFISAINFSLHYKFFHGDKKNLL
jgi:trk system potassium uptake protein TrkH